MVELHRLAGYFDKGLFFSLSFPRPKGESLKGEPAWQSVHLDRIHCQKFQFLPAEIEQGHGKGDGFRPEAADACSTGCPCPNENLPFAALHS